MKRQGGSIIFINHHQQVLLLLRDDIPSIPYPNHWDLPGGQVENGETPEGCIVREMKEELDLDLEGFALFAIAEMADRTEFTFWKTVDLDIDKINLTEGQCLRWCSEEEVNDTPLAFGFNQIIEEFFRTFNGRI